MKKYIALLLAVGCAALFFAAGAEALTAAGSFQAFIEAVERFDERLSRAVPWDELDEEDVLPMDPVAQLRYFFRPLFNLGVSKDSIENEKESHGLESVTYDEQGNKFRILCKYKTGDRQNYEGTYDQESDRMICRWVWDRGPGGGIIEDLVLEYMKTDFGYVARLYDVSRECVHKLAIRGDEGMVSWGFTKFETLYASKDYPKEGGNWYEISGDRFIFQPRKGPAREYVIIK